MRLYAFRIKTGTDVLENTLLSLNTASFFLCNIFYKLAYNIKITIFSKCFVYNEINNLIVY